MRNINITIHMTLHYSTYNITNLAVMHTEKFCAHKPVLAGTTKHACRDPTLTLFYVLNFM